MNPLTVIWHVVFPLLTLFSELTLTVVQPFTVTESDLWRLAWSGGLLMDCRPTTLIPDLARLGVQLAAEVARSEAVWGLTRGAADREPGHGAAEKRAVGGGEKGSGAAVTASPSRHALASLGVRNQRSSDTEAGKATVWSGTFSLAASFAAEARVWLAASRHCC